MQLFFEVKDVDELCFLVLNVDKGKYLFYSGIYEFVIGKIEDGVKYLEEVFCLMNDMFEQRIIKIIVYQILVFYY